MVEGGTVVKIGKKTLKKMDQVLSRWVKKVEIDDGRRW